MQEDEKNEILNEARREVTEIYDALVVNKENVKIPENIFTDYFLPFFAGKEKQDDKVILAEWISIAGTPTSEVDVVNDSNEKLFTVPSIFDTSIINIPKVARDNLSRNLNNKFMSMVEDSPNIKRKKEEWNNILNRYGYIDTKEDNKATAIGNDDDLIYD